MEASVYHEEFPLAGMEKSKRRVLIPNTSAGLHFLSVLDAAISEIDLKPPLLEGGMP